MAIYNCKKCGGNLKIIDQISGLCKCEYCRSTQTIPSDNDEKKVNLYNTANKYRRANQFDHALDIYQGMIKEFPDEAESYWGAVLCRFGIEYVVDPKTNERIPTCHRTIAKPIFEDPDYILACEKASYQVKAVYEQEAKEIDRIQKKIIMVASHEEPFDIFISYKELNDKNGQRTQDSVIAQELYKVLTNEGYKVFFSRITLEKRLGEDYEPIIFSALKSSKVLLLVGTSSDNMNSPWVRNEWSRFLNMMDTEPGTKYLIPVYAKMDPYSIPAEITSRHIQALDATKIGFQQDLVHGIKKINIKSQKNVSESIVSGASFGNAGSIIERGFICLQDKDYRMAADVFNQAMNVDPHAAGAYIGRLMAKRKVSNIDDLREEPDPLSKDKDYLHAMEYADPKLKKQLREYEKSILYNNRIEAEKAIEEKREDIEDTVNDLEEQANNCQVQSEQADSLINEKSKILEKAEQVDGQEGLLILIILVPTFIYWITRVLYYWGRGDGVLGKVGAIVNSALAGLALLFGAVILILIFMVFLRSILGKPSEQEQKAAKEAIEKANKTKSDCSELVEQIDQEKLLLSEQMALLNQSEEAIAEALKTFNRNKIKSTLLGLDLHGIETTGQLIEALER